MTTAQTPFPRRYSGHRLDSLPPHGGSGLLALRRTREVRTFASPLQSGGIDGMLAGSKILTAFKFCDTARYVTNINMNQTASVSLVNEAWFQSQSDEVRTAIAEADRAEKAWLDNGGKVHILPDHRQAELQETVARVVDEVIIDQPEVIELKNRIVSRLEEVRIQ